MLDEAKYDKRIVNLNNPPPGYDEYIKSLHCCLCGSVDSCNCTVVKSKPKPKPKVEIKSVCSPHRDWIEAQIDLGTSAKDIYKGLIQKFEFRNKYTSVKDFVRKLKGLKYDT
jgi:hypothetical protein